MKQSKVLFILKERQDYNIDSETGQKNFSTGLLNSTQYVVDMLNVNGVESKLVVVKDNNSIDKEVTEYKPTHVVIEALWVVPSKFEVLRRLHPEVKWFVHLHSDLPFIANESMAMEWISAYSDQLNVTLIANSRRLARELRFFLKHKNDFIQFDADDSIVFLPNYYPVATIVDKTYEFRKDEIHIGCFGAIRPLKNQMIQAFAAVMFGDKMKKRIVFHINTGRIEQRGESVLKNIQSFFESLAGKGHRLVEHEWYSREDFLNVCLQMDMGMQCSFSETFNIVCADLVTQGVPVIASSEVSWVDPTFYADPTDTEDMTDKLIKTFKNPKRNTSGNVKGLIKHSEKAEDLWVKFFTK